MKLIEAFGLRDVRGYKSTHGVDNNVVLPDQLVGLELEIEHFPLSIDDATFGGITFTIDGSLREGGIEAVTKPVAIQNVRYLLEAFYRHFDVSDGNYSDRCSTHVHFNVLPYTFEQIMGICMIYQTVETLLFNMVGHDRDSNVFCVPWSQCSLNYSVVTKMSRGVDHTNAVFRQWQKYAACNLMPAVTQGTIEFRHLHGTCDVDVIMRWINSISCMFKHVQERGLIEIKSEIINMNTVSNYHNWLGNVFGDYASFLRTEDFERALAAGVIQTKLMLLENDPMPRMRVDPPRRGFFLDETLERANIEVPAEFQRVVR